MGRSAILACVRAKRRPPPRLLPLLRLLLLPLLLPPPPLSFRNAHAPRRRSAYPTVTVPESIAEAGWHSAAKSRESEAAGRARVGRIAVELHARARALRGTTAAADCGLGDSVVAKTAAPAAPTDAAARETGAVSATAGPAAAAPCTAVAYVVHGDFLNLLVQALLGAPVGNGVQFAFHNASMSVVDVYASGVVVLARLNAVGHVRAEEVTPPWNAV
jgi:hypothetical protein